MAVSWAELAAWETAAIAANKPCMIINAINTLAPTHNIWSDDVNPVDGTNRTDPTYPVYCGYDGYPHLTTRPTGAYSTWSYTFQFPSPGIEFDCIALIGHNFGTQAATGINLKIGTSKTFGTSYTAKALGSFSGLSDDRVCSFDLHHTGAVPLRYTDVRWVRIEVVKGSNWIPQIGDLWLGRRYQLVNTPDNPFSKDRLISNSKTVESISGVKQRFTYSSGAYGLKANIKLNSATQTTNLRNWFLNQDGSFIWCWNPSSAPNAFNLMSQSADELGLENEEWNCQDAVIEAVEQGPERFYLARE